VVPETVEEVVVRPGGSAPPPTVMLDALVARTVPLYAIPNVPVSGRVVIFPETTSGKTGATLAVRVADHAPLPSELTARV
jgi:hypothetical protein